MRRYCLVLMIFIGILRANQYDYLLFSHVLSDVQSGFDLKADVNARWKGMTPLYEAVRNNRFEIAYLLIMGGADVNALNYGESALHRATQNKNVYLVQLLLQAGAKVNIQDENFGNTSLHYAAQNNDSQLFNLLLSRQGDLSVRNYQGITPSQIMMREIIIPPIILEDMNVAVSASAFKLSRGVVTFNIRNLTNEPLVIFSTELYVNGVQSGSQMKPIVIPAGTIASNVNMMQVGTNGLYTLKPDKNGKVDVKAGFNIVYQAEGRVQRVFNSRQMQLRLWNVPITKDTKDIQDGSGEHAPAVAK